VAIGMTQIKFCPSPNDPGQARWFRSEGFWWRELRLCCVEVMGLAAVRDGLFRDSSPFCRESHVLLPKDHSKLRRRRVLASANRGIGSGEPLCSIKADPWLAVRACVPCAVICDASDVIWRWLAGAGSHHRLCADRCELLTW